MELICTFYSNYSLLNLSSSIYTCTVEEVSRIAYNGRIVSIIGEHEEGKSNADVESVHISGVKLDFFPRYLCKYFPNLKSILITSGELKKLSKFDFIGCEGLEKLMIIGNDISTIDNDVFDYAPNIESISLFKNNIKFIGEKVFDKMERLRYVNLKMNNGIDCCYKEHGCGLKTLEELKEAIKRSIEKREREEHWIKLKTSNTKDLSEIQDYQFLSTSIPPICPPSMTLLQRPLVCITRF